MGTVETLGTSVGLTLVTETDGFVGYWYTVGDFSVCTGAGLSVCECFLMGLSSSFWMSLWPFLYTSAVGSLP